MIAFFKLYKHPENKKSPLPPQKHLFLAQPSHIQSTLSKKDNTDPIPKSPYRFPARSCSNGASSTAGVPLDSSSEVTTVAKGTDGEPGSGVYSVDLQGESSGPKVQELLAGFRREGVVETFWKHTEEEFRRITGKEAV